MKSDKKAKSLPEAIEKAKYWLAYSLENFPLTTKERNAICWLEEGCTELLDEFDRRLFLQDD